MYFGIFKILAVAIQRSRNSMWDYQRFIYSPTETQVSCIKNNINIYIKTAPTCFGAVTP
jgi:hypothetical protein